MEATKVISVLEYAEIEGVFLNKLYLCYNNMVQLENDHKLSLLLQHQLKI